MRAAPSRRRATAVSVMACSAARMLVWVNRWALDMWSAPWSGRRTAWPSTARTRSVSCSACSTPRRPRGHASITAARTAARLTTLVDSTRPPSSRQIHAAISSGEGNWGPFGPDGAPPGPPQPGVAARTIASTSSGRPSTSTRRARCSQSARSLSAWSLLRSASCCATSFCSRAVMPSVTASAICRCLRENAVRSSWGMPTTSHAPVSSERSQRIPKRCSVSSRSLAFTSASAASACRWASRPPAPGARHFPSSRVRAMLAKVMWTCRCGSPAPGPTGRAERWVVIQPSRPEESARSARLPSPWWPRIV